MASPLLEWIRANATHVSESIDPLAASSGNESDGSGDVDRTIIARSAVSATQTLVTLERDAVLSGSAWLNTLGTPQASSISSENANDDDNSSARELRDELLQRQLSPTVMLALALLHECARKQHSRFAGYIAQLPQRIPLPLAWSESARCKLKHTAAAPSIDADLVASVFASSVVPLTSKFASIWPADECCFARFQWAYAVVSSRAFRLGDSAEPTLLPVIDMANHAAVSPAAEIIKLDDGSFQLVARRAIAQNEAVTISYGDLSNAELLCRYGFVLSESVASDCLLVSSSELLATYAAFLNHDVDNVESDAEDEDEDAEQAQEPASKKRRVFTEKKKRADDADADALFFRLHGDQSKEFGLGDELLSFVFAKSLPADALYDVLAVLLRKRDKVYSRTLEQTEQAVEAAAGNAHELALLQLLTKHERAVCRRMLIGILTLEENSSDEDDDGNDDDEVDSVDTESAASVDGDDDAEEDDE